MSNYNKNQNSIRRWDNILNNLRKDIANLKRLTLKNIRNQNLRTNSSGLIRGNGASTTTVDTGNLGVMRIFLNDSFNLNEDDDEVIIPPDSWEVDFLSPSDFSNTLNNNLFTVPTVLNGQSLIGKNIYLEFDLHLSSEILIDRNENHFLNIEVIKNYDQDDDEEVALFKYGQSFLINSEENENILFTAEHINLRNTLKCKSGDTFNVFVTINGNIKVLLENDRYESYINFKIIRID